MRKSKRGVRGITLVALVVTIIVLLILAGIAINLIVGDNGLFSRSRSAVEEYRKSSAEEKIKLAVISYQIGKEETTLYEELRVIDGLTSITPSDISGPPYTVIVDSYEFEVKEDLSIEYKSKREDTIESMPKIIEINYNENQEVEKLPVTIIAKTEDIAGLSQIIISYKREEDGKIKYEDIKNEVVTGKEVTVQVDIEYNGKYVVQAVGKNGKIAKEEITINNIKEGGILATITLGNLLENNEPKVNLKIKGEGQGIIIKQIQLYVAGENVKTYNYDDLQNIREETYEINNLEFYKNVECYAKVIGSNKETNSETVNVMNDRLIKTAVDLQNLVIQVNDNENSFQGKTIQLIDNIEAGKNWIPIGYLNEVKQKYFSGVFEGNNHEITIESLSKDSKYQSAGIFGHGRGCIVKNLIVNGTIDATTNSVGGIIGFLDEGGKVENCTNNSTLTATTGNWIGGIVGLLGNNGEIKKCNNTGRIYGNSLVGGICGYSYTNKEGYINTISNCSNSGLIKCHGITAGTENVQYGQVGGICGLTDTTTIEKSTNSGEVTADEKSLLPKGLYAGGIVGTARTYTNIYTSKNKGKVHYDIAVGTLGDAGGALGGIAGNSISSNIEQCFNEGIITAKYNNNYGLRFIAGIVGYSNATSIKNTYNVGEIYGEQSVGGIVGYANVEGGATKSSCIYNSYNASEKIEGLALVGDFLGTAYNTTGGYFSCIAGKTWGIDYDCSWDETALYTLEQMKTKDSGLLTLLLKGDGTVNQKAIWAQDSDINGGLPYLVNNKP